MESIKEKLISDNKYYFKHHIGSYTTTSSMSDDFSVTLCKSERVRNHGGFRHKFISYSKYSLEEAGEEGLHSFLTDVKNKLDSMEYMYEENIINT